MRLEKLLNVFTGDKNTKLPRNIFLFWFCIFFFAIFLLFLAGNLEFSLGFWKVILFDSKECMTMYLIVVVVFYYLLFFGM